MIYIYKCSCKNSNIELEKGMNEEFTKEQLTCPDCGKFLVRDYQAESGHKGITVPDEHKATNSTKPTISYDKSPSGRKHIWTTGKWKF